MWKPTVSMHIIWNINSNIPLYFSPPALYDLEQHDKVNYINNKAEKGEYWRGRDPENESHRSSLPDTGVDQTRDAAPTFHQRVNMVKPIHIRTDNGTASYHSRHNGFDTNNVKGGEIKDKVGLDVKLPNIPDVRDLKDSNQNAKQDEKYFNDVKSYNQNAKQGGNNLCKSPIWEVDDFK